MVPVIMRQNDQVNIAGVFSGGFEIMHQVPILTASVEENGLVRFLYQSGKSPVAFKIFIKIVITIEEAQRHVSGFFHLFIRFKLPYSN